MDSATDAGLPVVVVQHTFPQPEMPFFKRGYGWELHPGGGVAAAWPLGTNGWPSTAVASGATPAASPDRVILGG